MRTRKHRISHMGHRREANTCVSLRMMTVAVCSSLHTLRDRSLLYRGDDDLVRLCSAKIPLVSPTCLSAGGGRDLVWRESATSVWW